MGIGVECWMNARQQLLLKVWYVSLQTSLPDWSLTNDHACTRYVMMNQTA